MLPYGTDGRTVARSDGRTDGRLDGRTDGWADGRTVGRTDGPDKYVIPITKYMMLTIQQSL